MGGALAAGPSHESCMPPLGRTVGVGFRPSEGPSSPKKRAGMRTHTQCNANLLPVTHVRGRRSLIETVPLPVFQSQTEYTLITFSLGVGGTRKSRVEAGGVCPNGNTATPGLVEGGGEKKEGRKEGERKRRGTRAFQEVFLRGSWCGLSRCGT